MTDGGNEDSGATDAPGQPPAAAAPPPAARPAPVRKRGRTTAVAAVVIVLLVVLAVVGSAPYWVPLLPWTRGAAPPPAPVVQALRTTEARVAQLETEVQALAVTAHAHPADTAAALAALGNRVAALEQRPAAPAANPQDITKLQQDVAALATRLDDVAARLGQVAAAQSAQASSDRTLLAALVALRAAMVASGPYDGALAAATALAHDDSAVLAALKPLAPAALSGIPSTALLAQRFAAATAPGIFRASAATPATGTGWGERILARIRALVVVRRIDGSGSDATTAAVAQAKQALDDGDLAAAVTALKPLSGAPLAAAAPWLALAQRRLDADGALDQTLHQVAARVAAEGH